MQLHGFRFKEYMSVTRNEFRTAVESGIPIFVMIDKKVMAEYGVYEANYDDIEKENRMMAFPTTKNINVFRFIKEIKGIVTLPIQEFERSSEIKGFISKQWADMFKNYLGILRNEKENRKIENSVNEMKSLIQKMDIMLDRVGKNVLSKNDSEGYKAVVIQQNILSLCNIIVSSFYLRVTNDFVKDSNKRKKIVKKFISLLKRSHKENLWNKNSFPNVVNHNVFFDFFKSEEFYVCEIRDEYIERVGDKYELLYDDKNEEQIINIITEFNCFYNLINYEGDYVI